MKALYSHTIQLIEPTKLLERNICDTMTVTNYLGHYYEGGTMLVTDYSISGGGASYMERSSNNVFTPYQAGAQFTPPRITDLYNINDTVIGISFSWGDCTITAIAPSGTRNELPINQTQAVTLTEEGSYTFEYDGALLGISGTNITPYAYTMTYSIGVFKDLPSYTDWTITDVVNRILSAGETRRVSLAGGTDIDKQKYFFDAEQANDYSTKPAPEFFFTRGTLRGALDTVGAFIHGIPRLQGDYQTIKYLELGKENPFTGKLPAPIYVDEQIAGDEYANVLDSPAQNLLNTTDRASGAVVEPSADGWRALNSTGGEWLIAANTMTIITDTPFYQVEKLELKWGTGGSTLDATAYLYEAAEYDVLSSYTGEAYPYSKGWALRYAQGGQEITGLNFVLDSALGGKDQNYAIVNILQALGVNVSNGADFANNLFYRVTYIPIAELRVTQKKPYLTHNGAGSLIYNQGGNTIESEYYGQKLKGVIARIGNKVNRRTYIIRRLKNLPQIGQTFYPDGVPERITNVDREFNTAYIKATVTSVPNFNRIAEYTGVNSNYRLYDISEKQSVDRFVHYEETCVISNSKHNGGKPMLSPLGMLQYRRMFVVGSAGNDNDAKITGIMITGKTGRTIDDAMKDTATPTITKSCASFGFGNSLVFYSNMTDNYGAGKQSTSYELNGQTRRASRQVQYGDGLGNISTIGVSLAPYIVFNDGGAFSYPEGNRGANPYFSTGDYPLFISKDSREAMHFTYQLHHQADNFDIVIGNGLCKYNPLVTAKLKPMRFGYMTYTIDKIDPKISTWDDYTSAGFFPSVTTSGNTICIHASDIPNKSDEASSSGAKTYYSWMIYTPAQGNDPLEVVIAQNYPDGIPVGSAPKDIYFNFVDNSVLATLGMAE